MSAIPDKYLPPDPHPRFLASLKAFEKTKGEVEVIGGGPGTGGNCPVIVGVTVDEETLAVTRTECEAKFAHWEQHRKGDRVVAFGVCEAGHTFARAGGVSD